MTKEETASFIRAYLDGDTAIGNIIPIRDVLESAITYLKEQPSLPEGLEEAAEEYVQTLCDRADEKLRIDTTLQSAFKARAEWMAGQGVTVVGEVGYVSESDHTPHLYIGDMEDEMSNPTLMQPFVSKADILVQIRKK